ncbi:MAG: response regulator transcription factor [Lentimicrobium sp.]|jgi:DNA-binding NarL/FixJ family response regulator|uniref:response regulator transcription factor n=2 Tax=Lentimicrobium sp. TaxID=2034841 RepID=UPI0025FB6F92|nr:response regulator transcription factor [Lentimicrobium sp.]MCO5255960.1 response regulator transcription factor [Lentimicrobium sp.]HPF65455.1 response regulator transcription factor [Lentimicrobium sp.]
MRSLKKIFIVDDDAVIRTGLNGIIRHTGLFEIAGEASNGEEFLHKLVSTEAEIVLLDLLMPGLHGSEVARRAMEINPDLKILICSAEASQEELYQLLDIGIFGFILKTEGFDQTIRALTNAANGVPYFSPELVGCVVNHSRPVTKPVQFSRRETEILGLLCKGYSMHEIALQLYISSRTVEKHRSNMMTKAKKKSTLDLVLFAIKNQIIAPEKIAYRSGTFNHCQTDEKQADLFSGT